jgi:hypothetical protein
MYRQPFPLEIPMSTVTAKFRVTSATPNQHGNGKHVCLTAVYSSDPAHENHSWSEATPAGNISMVISNPAAAEAFEEGAEYLVEFSKA